VVKLLGPFRIEAAPPPPTLLALAILRPSCFTWAATQASELGCDVLVPLLTERCRVSAEYPAPKIVRRCRCIAVESRKQCGRNAAMTVTDPMTVQEFLAAAEDLGAASGPLEPARIIADPSGLPVFSLLASLPDGVLDGPPTPSPALMVGPEGGFADSEKKDAALAGFLPVSFGPYTLKAETAAVTGLAAISGHAYHLRHLRLSNGPGRAGG
jgi:16S rRNA (uracil1498-N3)-methyltransferase